MGALWSGESAAFAPILGRAILPSYQDGVVLGDRDGVETERLRVFTLSGFRNQMLNQEYVENLEWAFQFCGRPTFWSDCSSFFMFFNGKTGCWNLALAVCWMEMKLGRRYPELLAFGSEHDIDGFGTGWHEHVKGKGFVWNPAARSSQEGFVVVDLQVKAKDLLATIPGAVSAARAFSRAAGSDFSPLPLTNPLSLKDGCYTVKDFLCVCTSLENLPADDGRLASSLQQENLSGFDAVFMALCMEAAQKAKRQTQELQKSGRR